MKVKFLCVMAVEATSLLPKLEAARAAGVIVMVIGGEPGESGRDAVMKMDQFLAGAYCARMAKQWVEDDLPRAAAGFHRDRRLHLPLDHRGGGAVQGPAHDQRTVSQELRRRLRRRAGQPTLRRKRRAYLAGKSDADRVANPVYCPAVKIVQTTDRGDVPGRPDRHAEHPDHQAPTSNWCWPTRRMAVTAPRRRSWTRSPRAPAASSRT